MSDVGADKIREYLELQVDLTKKDFSKIMEEFLNLYHERMGILELVLRSECDRILCSNKEKMVKYLVGEIKNKINFKKYSVDDIYHSVSEFVKSERELLESYRNDTQSILDIIDAMDEINNAI